MLNFSKKEAPSDVPEQKIGKKNINIVDLLVETKMALSRSEARRLIEQKGVRVNNETVLNADKIIILEKSALLQVGPRKFLKVLS